MPDEVDTAAFYSISNCQRGLAGVSFGNFLIKQVVEEISKDNPRLKTFVTLSPVPGFAAWLKRERQSGSSRALTQDDLAALANLDTEGWWQVAETREPVEEPLMRAAAWYFMHARNARGPAGRSGRAVPSRQWRAAGADQFPCRLLRERHAPSYGVMVNYLYDLDDIEKNHEAYAENRTVVASNAVKKLARPGPTGDLIAVSSKA